MDLLEEYEQAEMKECMNKIIHESPTEKIEKGTYYDDLLLLLQLRIDRVRRKKRCK